MKILQKQIFVIIFLCFISSTQFVFSQSFHLTGTAAEMEHDCIQLTPDEYDCRGLAYHKTKLNLNHFFQIEFDIYLGDKDEGADGIAFVIHNDPRGFDAYGTWGECLGYGRWSEYYLQADHIAPSIAIEFDTYQNLNQNDPESDHVAYLENGVSKHTIYWNGQNDAFNLEDDLMHSFSFRWEPDIKLISVYLDGYLVVQKQRDLVNDIFKGQSEVIWGFTASTGGSHNLQFFCLKKLAKAD